MTARNYLYAYILQIFCINASIPPFIKALIAKFLQFDELTAGLWIIKQQQKSRFLPEDFRFYCLIAVGCI